jgi:hypothetical protein
MKGDAARRASLRMEEAGIVLGTIGKGNLRKAFENSVKAIEARSNGGTSAEPTETGEVAISGVRVYLRGRRASL